MTEPRKFTSEEFAACLEELEVEEARGSAWIVLELRAENEKLRRAHRVWEVGHALVAPRIAENERLRAAWEGYIGTPDRGCDFARYSTPLECDETTNKRMEEWCMVCWLRAAMKGGAK